MRAAITIYTTGLLLTASGFIFAERLSTIGARQGGRDTSSVAEWLSIIVGGMSLVLLFLVLSVGTNTLAQTIQRQRPASLRWWQIALLAVGVGRRRKEVLNMCAEDG